MPGPVSVPTFYWHDYETFGIDPKRDRPAQFGGLRTTMELEPVDAPSVFYCRPANDLLPQPEACLITGITPHLAASEGVCEAQFAARIHEELSAPNTCAAGYNSLRFDDEFTRHLLYRNFFDPYAREWENGNSRWDLIDLVRLTYALRPDGIVWPMRDDQSPSFQLGDLTSANNLVHAQAHDALSDVHATIGLARLIRQRQPRLFDFYLQLRRKQRVLELLDCVRRTPVLHVSSRYPANRGCLAMIVPLAMHPTQPNAVIVYDLNTDPEPLITLDPTEIAERVFTAQSALPENIQRVPLKLVRANRSPALAPLSVLNGVDCARIGLDQDRCMAHLQLIEKATNIGDKVRAVFSRPLPEQSSDPELTLYSGGFLNDQDRLLLLGQRDFDFSDPRYCELLFRYRARNYPSTLNAEETIRWNEFRRKKLTADTPLTNLPLEAYFREIERLTRTQTAASATDRKILDELMVWGQKIL